MEHKKIFGMIAMILILVSIIPLAMPLANAEISVQGFNSIVDTSSTNSTRQIITVTIDDTSLNDVMKKKPANITVEVNHYLNSSVIANKSIIDCIFQSVLISHNYDVDGNLINISTTTTNYNWSYLDTDATSLFHYQLYDQDILQATLVCDWNDTVDDKIFQYFIGSNIANMFIDSQAFWCLECGRNDYAELITKYIDTEKVSVNYLVPFSKATIMVNAVMILFTYLYWIIKIFGLLFLVALCFAVGIWFYGWVRKLGK